MKIADYYNKDSLVLKDNEKKNPIDRMLQISSDTNIVSEFPIKILDNII